MNLSMHYSFPFPQFFLEPLVLTLVGLTTHFIKQGSPEKSGEPCLIEDLEIYQLC